MHRSTVRRRLSISCIAGLSAGLACSVPTAATPDHPDGDVALETIIRSAAVEAFAVGDPFDAGGVSRASIGFSFGGGAVEGDGPNGIAFLPDGSKAVVAHRESRNLVLWNPDLTPAGSVALPGAPVSVAVTPDSSKAVVALVDTDNAAIVDLNAMSVIATVPVGESPGAAVVMPAGDLAVVSAAFDSELVVIDLGTNTEVRRISDIGFSQTISFSTLSLQRITYSSPTVVDNDRIINLDRFRPNSDPAEIQFINVRTGAVNRLVPGVDDPNDADVSADGSTIVVAHANEPVLTVIDPVTEMITGSIALPENANFSAQIAINNDGTKGAYTVSNNTRVVDLVTGVSGPTLGTATLNDLITTPDGNRVAGVGFRGSVIDLNTGANLGNANQVISTDLGAMSPDGSFIFQVSTTFGEDIVKLETDATPTFVDWRSSGPDFEGDRMILTAVSPDGSVAVGSNRVSGTAVVYDTATGNALAQLAAGRRGDGIGISPDGSKAVIANGDSFFATVIDLQSLNATDIPMGRRGTQTLFSPDSTYVYIPVQADGDGVTRINLNTLSVEGPKITTGNLGGVGYAYSRSSTCDISPDGSLIAVCGSFTDNVSFIDATNWVDLGDTTVGDLPSFVKFSPDGTQLAVTNRNDDSISIIDVATRAVIDTFPTGDSPGFPIFTGDGRLLVVEFTTDTLIEHDLATGNITGAVPFVPLLGTSVAILGVDIDYATNRLYVSYGNSAVTLGGDVGFAISEEGYIDIFDATTLAFIGQLDLAKGPSDLSHSDDFNVLATGAPFGDGIVIAQQEEPCPFDLADTSGFGPPDGQVDFGDFFALSFLAGPCPGGTPGCTGDFADSSGFGPPDGMIDFGDFFALSFEAGPCP